MRAWLNETPGQMRLGEVDTPEPGPGEVRVRVETVGINRADLVQVKGNYPPPPGFDPRMPGLEYAGTIDAVGARVLGRKVGEPVMGLIGGGAYAEYVTIHEAETIPVPAGLDMAAAGGVPEVFLTAYRAMYLIGGLQPGQSCLIRPASAGVGLAAVQLAAALGSRPLGTSRDLARLAEAEALGLAGSIVDNDDMAARVRELTGDAGAAVVVDMIGGNLTQSLAALRDEGTLVLLGLLAGRESPVALGDVLRRRLSLRGMTMRSLPLDGRIQMARLFSDRLTPLFEAGRLKAFIAAEYPFEDAERAHADMAAGRFSGKLVLRM